MTALAHIPVGVLVDRIKADSPWVDFIWQPRAVLVGEPDTPPWTQVSSDGGRTIFYAGSATIELYASSAPHYRDNLSGDGCAWVILTPGDGDPPYRLSAVTVDPTEGEGFTQAGDYLVDSVPLPPSLRAALEDFVAQHLSQQQPFFKRERKRADPEALGRRDPAKSPGEGKR